MYVSFSCVCVCVCVDIHKLYNYNDVVAELTGYIKTSISLDASCYKQLHSTGGF